MEGGQPKLAAEQIRLDVERELLTPDQGVIEFDFGFNAQAAQVRPQFAVAAVVGIDPYRLEHLDVAPTRRHRRNTGLIDRIDEGRSAAVHDRNFGTVDLDNGVVDPKPEQRGKHVFGGGYGRTVSIAEHRGEFGRCHRSEVGRKFAVFLAIDSDSPEYDAGIRFSRMKRYRNGRTGMDADAGNANLLAQGRLPAGLHALHLLAGLQE